MTGYHTFGLPVLAAPELRDGMVVKTRDALLVGTRPLTFAEEVARDCAYIIRRGFQPWLARWGEAVENQPSSEAVFAALRALGAP